MALETMLALVAEHTANPVLILDAGRNVLWANASFARLTGYPASEVVGRMLADSLRLDQSDPVTLARFRERLEQGLHVGGEILVRSKLDRDMWASIDMQPVRDGSGVLTGWVVVASDIDEQVRQRRQRAALFQVLPVGVIVYASKGEVLEINPAALEMLGLQREQVSDYATVYAAMRKRGRVVREDLSDYPVEDRPVQRTLRSGQPLRGVLIGYVRSNGDLAWTMVNTEPLLDDQGGIRGVVMCFVDVTMQKSLERDLRESARTDGLTQLPNRVVVTDRIRASLARRRSQPGYHFAVLFMDFDRFKQVNDTLGHGVGDALLRQIAERLQAGLRPVDTLARTSEPVRLAARIGGDEFVVLLDDVGGDPEVEAVAARLLAALAAPYRIGEHVVNSGVSIGIVTATVASDDVDTILRDADIAMYEAKRTGRGRFVFFEPAMQRRVRDDVSLENDLREAVANGKMQVVYQPLVELDSGRIAGMEALVRWNHPLRGPVPPVEFIPVAEAVGLIGVIGEQVLRAACAQFAAIQASDPGGTLRSVSVNLSRAQLREPSLVGVIADALRCNGMQAAQLQLEITESLAAQDHSVQARLREIKALGVTLALDDFGTGYSSLSCLHELPIDTVKIDRAFVSMAQTSDYHRVLIEATILVARTLRMTTVAEGIETIGQADLMRALGCSKGQGYLFSAPLSGAALVEWMKGNIAPG